LVVRYNANEKSAFQSEECVPLIPVTNKGSVIEVLPDFRMPLQIDEHGGFFALFIDEELRKPGTLPGLRICTSLFRGDQFREGYHLNTFAQRIATSSRINHPQFIQFQIPQGDAHGGCQRGSIRAFAFHADPAPVLEQEQVEFGAVKEPIRSLPELRNILPTVNLG
jgi:hypothetical protein